MTTQNKVVYNCGCGYSTPEIPKAIAHAEETGHTLTAFGEIRGISKRKKGGKPECLIAESSPSP